MWNKGEVPTLPTAQRNANVSHHCVHYREDEDMLKSEQDQKCG